MICTVCELAEGVWRNPALLGTEDTLCWECCKLWRGEGVRSREEMRARRMQQSRKLEEGRQQT